MAIKVKELKNDAVVSIKVNKNYYLMAKAALYYLFTNFPEEENKKEEALKTIMESKHEDMNELQRAFYTLTLLITEIEKSASEQDLVEEKEVLVPGDEGYIAPNQD